MEDLTFTITLMSLVASVRNQEVVILTIIFDMFQWVLMCILCLYCLFMNGEHDSDEECEELARRGSRMLQIGEESISFFILDKSMVLILLICFTNFFQSKKLWRSQLQVILNKFAFSIWIFLFLYAPELWIHIVYFVLI